VSNARPDLFETVILLSDVNCKEREKERERERGRGEKERGKKRKEKEFWNNCTM